DPPLNDDPPGHTTAVPLLAKVKKQPGKFFFAPCVNHHGGGRSGFGIEAHIERPVDGETEPTMRPAKLIRGKSKVEQHTIHGTDTQFEQDLPEVAVRPLGQGDW